MNRLFFLGFLFTVIASIFWGAMGTAVQHLFHIQSGFNALGLVTLRQLAAGVLFLSLTVKNGEKPCPARVPACFSTVRKLL